MKNYFTFFLCARDWGRVEETVYPALERILEVLPSSRDVSATARLKSGAAQGPPRTLSDSYRRLRLKVRPEEITYLILHVAGRTPAVFELSASFENVRYRHTPEYLRITSPRTPERVEDEAAFKIFSFSIRQETYRGLGAAGRTALREAAERLFVATPCAYGYGHPTAWPVATPYQFIRDGSQQSGRLVADFDYASHIEDVYLCNYLSESHLHDLAAPDDLCQATAAGCKRLHDDLGRARGMAVYLEDAPAKTRNLLAARLRPLVLTDAPPRQSYHLLLHGSLWNPSVKNALGRYRFAARVTELPDFVRVELAGGRNPEDVIKYYADLDKFFERLCPGSLRGGRHAAELIVQHRGLFDATEIFQRVPGLGAGPSPDAACYAELYFTSEVKLARLRLLFILNAADGDDSLPRLADAVGNWLSALRRHPNYYGNVGVIEEFGPVTIEGRVHAEIVIEATRLEQDGFNLLMLMLDELNRRRCIISYVVCGEH